MFYSDKMNFSEKIAYYIIRTKMRDYKVEFNEQQSHGEVDFKLKKANESYVIPMEVTTSVEKENTKETNENIKRAQSISRKERRKCCWNIIPRNIAVIKKITSEIDDLLYTLEQAGITKIYSYKMYEYDKKYDKNIVDVLKKIFYELNIEFASCVGKKNGKIHIGFPIYGSLVDENNINEAVEKELKKEDNIKKLKKGLKEKYFFIYVDANDNCPVYNAMHCITNPETYFKIDGEVYIDNLIVLVATFFSGEKCIIWKTRNNCRWKRYDIKDSYDDQHKLLNE